MKFPHKLSCSSRIYSRKREFYFVTYYSGLLASPGHSNLRSFLNFVEKKKKNNSLSSLCIFPLALGLRKITLIFEVLGCNSKFSLFVHCPFYYILSRCGARCSPVFTGEGHVSTINFRDLRQNVENPQIHTLKIK